MPEISDGGTVRIGVLSQQFDISVPRLRHLADTQQIPSTRTAGGHRLFDVDAVRETLARLGRPSGGAALGPLPVVPVNRPTRSTRHVLAGLEEDRVWRDAQSALELDSKTPATRSTAYAFTEMLNNAIDHSGGAFVDVDLWSDRDRLAFRIRDDGRGVFPHLREALGLAEDVEAIAELSKGKRTTAPDRHTGEGIFFTSKLADVFRLESAGLRWTVDNIRDDHAVGISPVQTGTTVFFEVHAATTKVPTDVFERFTEDFGFVRTRPVVRLFELGRTFVSRSEARRLLAGLDQFTEIDVDFTGVEEVGQGFVDELFRVWPAGHPGHLIEAINMNPAVEFMVRRGLPPRS